MEIPPLAFGAKAPIFSGWSPNKGDVGCDIA
jgi:hypothetical protein